MIWTMHGTKLGLEHNFLGYVLLPVCDPIITDCLQSDYLPAELWQLD